jgi:hypothetical protein
MPQRTRRRSADHPRQPCWEIYYGDVHAGMIAERTGNPRDTEQWEWRCGFYPGSRPGECQHGKSASFDEARRDFEAAWRVFLSKRTEADFQACRDKRDWTALVESRREAAVAKTESADDVPVRRDVRQSRS